MVNEGVTGPPVTANPNGEAEGTNPHSPTTEIASKPVEEVEVIAVDKKAQDDYMLTHNFEKVETAEEFNGIWRGFDGDDELADHADALNELNLKHLVRTDEQAHSVYRAEFRGSVKIAESEDADTGTTCVSYPEWDLAKKLYKPDYCKVFLSKIKGGDLTYAQKCLSENKKTLDGLRRKFAQIHQQRRMVRRMPDGENIDMDALVDWFADLRSGHTPSENIYNSTRKKDPNIALLFLLDLSLSTDSYADGNRVLDVEKQAVILFGEALNEYGVDFAVGGFCSQTRNRCTFHTLKDFGEGWIKGKQRLGSVEPQGYTRIGPALRHRRRSLRRTLLARNGSYCSPTASPTITTATRASTASPTCGRRCGNCTSDTSAPTPWPWKAWRGTTCRRCSGRTTTISSLTPTSWCRRWRCCTDG
ncbi:MAG: hypothetical protein IPL27_17605 [Lewinellaceae bacterium]|nr:hypothetical protein [Lewinellaceae bacterium]